MARELAPAGLRSSPNLVTLNQPDPPRCMIWGRFAAQREQAPSPQKPAEVHALTPMNQTLKNTCGSELARDSGRPANIDVA